MTLTIQQIRAARKIALERRLALLAADPKVTRETRRKARTLRLENARRAAQAAGGAR